MKKDKKSKNKRPERSEELRELNSQLGSFGLEPPKIYRRDQRINDYSESSQIQRQRKKPSQNTQQRTKKQNKKRRLKKKVRKALYLILMILGVAAVLVVLSLTVLFKIETITIKGNEIYSSKQISAVLSIEKDSNLFIADTKGAEKKIEENLPYVYDANIKRKFPSTILVNITETPKIYYIKNRDKTYTLMDDNFKVLEVGSNKKPKDALEIRKASLKTATAGMSAAFTSDKTGESLKTLSRAIKDLKLEEATAIYSVDINNNYIVYDNRITLKLGTLDKLEEKIYSALTAIEKLNEANPQAEGEMTANGDKQVYFTEN